MPPQPRETLRRQLRSNLIKREGKNETKRTVGALLLVLALTTFAHAGEMGNGSPQPPQQPAQTTTATSAETNDSAATTDGDMGNGVAATATETALSLLPTLLALL